MTETSQLKPTPETRSTSPPTHNAKLRIASRVSNAFVAGVLKVSPHGDLKTLCYHNRFKERLTLIVPVANPIPSTVGCEIACDSLPRRITTPPSELPGHAIFTSSAPDNCTCECSNVVMTTCVDKTISSRSNSTINLGTWVGRAIHNCCYSQISSSTWRGEYTHSLMASCKQWSNAQC